SSTRSSHPSTKEPFVALAIPSVSLTPDAIHYGNAQSSSTRSFTPLKAVGDGSFGTVWLCDWHGPLPPNTSVPAMQSGQGARPEYASKRLVAVKRMKKKWEGGWDECKKLKELEALRAIPMHPNIIPLYDSFLLPHTKELYFVFEPMEGHLFQLIKARRGRPLAGGLVSSIFRQIVSGLHHIHVSGYFHRDMKPENVLVTTTGLFDYPNISPTAPPDAPPEKDVVVIIKLADFGLARETKSRPPYTEYVSTRWYRAPEVLLKSRDYSNPVDMWALGTIMAELVNLRPLFPGKGEVDQVAKITEILGDPSDEYGKDARGKAIGGGKWSKGIKMAKNVGLTFKKITPVDFYSLFDRSIPVKLVECIADLLKYDPNERLTSQQCLEHPYLLETTARINAPPPPLTVSTSAPLLNGHQQNGAPSIASVSPRTLPPSHPHPPPALAQIPDASASHRQSFYPVSPGHTNSEYGSDVEYMVDGHPMDIQRSPMAQEYPSRPPLEQDLLQEATNGATHEMLPSGNKFGKLGSLGFRKQHKWAGLGGMFGHGDKSQQNVLPPVEEMHVTSSSSTPSLKRTQSSSTDSRSLPEQPPVVIDPPLKDAKKIKKEAERMAKEAELQRRAMLLKSQRDQARAVMEKRNQVLTQSHTRGELEWKWNHSGALAGQDPHPPDLRAKGSTTMANGGGGPIRQVQGAYAPGPYDWRRDERMHKARRREHDDDHSMSSSDVQSIGPMSTISFATVDSDPGPSRLHHRPSMFGGISRMTSSSSLRHLDDFPTSARSSNSLSFEQQFVNDFHVRASVDSSNSMSSEFGSPPPMHALTLSPSRSWQTVHPRQEEIPDVAMEQPQPSRLAIPQQHHPQQQQQQIPFGGNLRSLSVSPGMDAPKSAINPIFKVPSFPSLKPGRDPPPVSTTPSLPPFAQIEAIADRDCPPLSPMSFTTP
ncbi:hypothetical protein HETIRDRAFT_235743, partial [Heterobasidion irregulare TC 32-1]